MKTLKLKNNDLVIENGDFVFTDEVLEQSLYVIFSSSKGEWFYSPEIGINRKNILGKVSDQTARYEVVQGVAQEPDIELIEDLSIERKADRSANIIFKGVANGEETEVEVKI